MSGKREVGISYGTTAELNLVNDAVCGGSSSQGTGATQYGGILGIEVSFTDSQVKYSSSIGTLYGGVYKYVQTLSTGGGGVRGQIAFWSDPDNFVVSATAQDGNQAGVFLNTVTAGNFCWIQVGGIASVLFRASTTKATPAVKDVVVCQTGAVVADVLADATNVTYGGAGSIKLLLGIAKTAPVGGTITLVELLERFSTPFA